MKYRVLIREVHVSHRYVEAASPEEAMNLAEDAEDSYTEYSHSLGRGLWTVEEVTS